MSSLSRPLLMLTALVAPGSVAIPATPLSEQVRAGGDLAFVRLDEIKIPIVDSNRVTGALRVKLVLQAADSASADAAARSIPQLRAAGLAGLCEFGRLYASAFSAVDVARLDAHLLAAIQRQDPQIARVLIVEVEASTA